MTARSQSHILLILYVYFTPFLSYISLVRHVNLCELVVPQSAAPSPIKSLRRVIGENCIILRVAINMLDLWWYFQGIAGSNSEGMSKSVNVSGPFKGLLCAKCIMYWC